MDREVREPARPGGRDRAHAGDAGRAVHLAGGHGQELQGRVRPARRHACACSGPARTASASEDEIIEGIDNPQASARFGDIFAHARQDIGARAGRIARLRPRGVSRGEADAALLRLGHQQFRRQGSAGRAGGVRAAAAAAQGDPARWSIRWRRSSPASSSRSRPTWTRAHRDRVAFIRVCSGHFERGMRLTNCRTGKDFRPDERGVVPVAAPRAGRGRLRRATSSASPTTACCSWAIR